MAHRPHTVRRPTRLAASLTVALVLVATSFCTQAATAGGTHRLPSLAHAPGRESSRAAAPTSLSSSVLDVVSSTGHRLRLHLVAFHSDTGTTIDIQVRTRSGAEEHDWSFDAPSSAVSFAATGKGHVRLGERHSAHRAIVSLRTVPHGQASRSTCHHKTATKTRHVSLSGTLLLRTRSKGKHAWGNVGTTHRPLHFSTRSKVTWTKAAASDCPVPEFPCRATSLWMASGGPVGMLDFFASANKGAHAQLAGVRVVGLADPSGATRTDLVTVSQPSPNQLIVAGDGSATLQATYHGGTVTMSSPQPAISQVERCGSGKKKISVDSWSGDLVNGTTPIVVPAQIFGAFSTADTPSASFGRIRVLH